MDLRRDYQPAPAVLKQLAAFDFVAVLGPSAAGKTTIIQAAVLAEPRLHEVVDDTSRDPRPGEQQGREYYFCSHQEMLGHIRERSYINVATGLHDNLYATNPARFVKDKVNLLPIWARDVPYFRQLPFKRLRLVYLVPPHYDLWMERLEARDFPADEKLRRLHEAKESLHFALQDEAVEFIIAETIEQSREDLITLALDQPRSSRLQADQSRAREAMSLLLKQLQDKNT